MDLAPGERQALAELEGQLVSSDPRLAAMFTRGAYAQARVQASRYSRERVGGLAAVMSGLAVLVAVAVSGVLMMISLA